MWSSNEQIVTTLTKSKQRRGKYSIGNDLFVTYQGTRDLALKNSLRTYKHEALKQMRENGELDTQVYGRVKADMATLKKADVNPRPFPAQADQIKYPEQALKKNLLY